MPSIASHVKPDLIKGYQKFLFGYFAMIMSFCSNMSNTKLRPRLTTFPNTEKNRVENATRSGMVFAEFEVFGDVVKHWLGCLIHLLNQH